MSTQFAQSLFASIFEEPKVDVRIESAPGFDMDNVRVLMRRRHGSGFAFLMEDGRWVASRDGAAIGPVGLSLPRAALRSLGEAIDTFLGGASDHKTETRLLREWLTVERDRNDRLIAALAGGRSDE